MGKRTEFLYLNEEEMIQAGVLDSALCVDVLDEMFQLIGKGDYIMGGPKHNEHGIKIGFPDNPEFEGMPANGPDRRFMAMVAYLGGRFKVAGEKWYGSNIINPGRGLPRSVLMVMMWTPASPSACAPATWSVPFVPALSPVLPCGIWPARTPRSAASSAPVPSRRPASRA